MKKILSILLVMLFSGMMTSVLAKDNEIITPQSQLQKRQYQTRSYENVSKAVIMKAVLNVLQDEGFIVNNANSILGFISGVKEFSPKDKTIDIEKEFGTKKDMYGVVVAAIESTANVTEYGKEIKVRINFKRKRLNVYGNAKQIEEITDEEYYQNFFSKVDKAIFLQKQKV
ncbi:MAG: hypothetical protein LUB59_04755 [Candidatus Gastranaerophilales bacterium]|nr:hypothetical protein [Candidatus Gastranaerophilales bacterium]